MFEYLGVYTTQPFSVKHLYFPVLQADKSSFGKIGKYSCNCGAVQIQADGQFFLRIRKCVVNDAQIFLILFCQVEQIAGNSFGTAFCSLPFLLAIDGITPMSGNAWAGMLWLGLFIDALATFAWGRALQLSEVGILSNFAYLTPVVAALLSYVILGEPIAAYSVIGMLLVLGGSLLRVIKIR